MINEITILAGFNKAGVQEDFGELTLKAGEMISIVGPTGSGKTAFITDIEVLAQRDTDTKRRILIDGHIPDDSIRNNPALKPISMITQNTKCFVDLPTAEFLRVHAQVRGISDEEIINKTIDLANAFTGEKIRPDDKVTALSGGQTRSLLIADAILISAAPMILLDEIENAGIFKNEAIDIIQGSGKIIVFVTHDPVVALISKKRLIMENGGVKKVLIQEESEVYVAEKLSEMDQRLSLIREELRAGNKITRELANFV